MQIAYATTKLEKLITCRSKLVRKYGPQAADSIIKRMQELDAAPNMAKLPPAARPHPRKPVHEGRFSLDILKHKHPTRLIIAAGSDSDPTIPETISSIVIEEIDNTIHS